ncbi:MAG: AAA family ATPase, partial [Peptostreptococcaceae bacterium]|nr:AAA family ATPase [Peptostreptococcaceae bacterium]
METPYYYIGDGSRTAFIRVGNQSIPVGAMELKRLVLHGSNKTYDSLTSQYKYKDFAFTKLRSVYRKRAGQELEESDFSSFGLTDEYGMLTNAGALLADDSPIRHSRLFCTRWYGIDKASGVMEAIDDKEFSGSLVTLLQSGEEFAKNNSKKRWKKTANGRTEMPDYPERAILECIVNALIHRDYLDVGSEVHIDIYDDRLEIYSPGGMYDGSIVQNLDIDRIPSRRRNPIIADIFNRMNYMERRGSGFKKIKGDYRKEVNYKESLEPKFYSDNKSFWAILFNLNYNVSIEKNGNADIGGKKVDIGDEKVDIGGKKVDIGFMENYLSYIKVNLPTKGKIKILYSKFATHTIFGRTDIAELLDISPTSASVLVTKMYKAGLLEIVAGQGKGKYKFK